MLHTLRVEEFEFYDINDDTEKVRVMAITDVGTWFTDLEHTTGDDKRTDKESFMKYVLGALQLGLEPSEVIIG